MVYRIVVKDEKGKDRMMDLGNTELEMQRITLGQLKKRITKVCGIPEDQQRLIFEGRELQSNEEPLFEYGIRHMSCIYATLRLCGGGLPPLHDRGLGDKEGETRRSKECVMPDV